MREEMSKQKKSCKQKNEERTFVRILRRSAVPDENALPGAAILLRRVVAKDVDGARTRRFRGEVGQRRADDRPPAAVLQIVRSIELAREWVKCEGGNVLRVAEVRESERGEARCGW